MLDWHYTHAGRWWWNDCMNFLAHLTALNWVYRQSITSSAWKPINVHRPWTYAFKEHYESTTGESTVIGRKTKKCEFYMKISSKVASKTGRFDAALLPRRLGKNPRSHHKGTKGRVQTGDQASSSLPLQTWTRHPHNFSYAFKEHYESTPQYDRRVNGDRKKDKEMWILYENSQQSGI